MRQVTLRLDDGIASRLKSVAAARGQSVNSYAEAIIGAATDPDLAGDEISGLRERLARAGLLAESPLAAPGPSADDVARARAHAGEGRSLAGLVDEGRR